MVKTKQTPTETPELEDQDFYTLLANTAEEDKVRLVMSILEQVKRGDSSALKILEKALLQKQSSGTDGRPIVFMPIEIMDREGIEYEVPEDVSIADIPNVSPEITIEVETEKKSEAIDVF